MASVMVQQQVKDFGAWKKGYESMSGVRSEKGAVSGQVFRDASDPNKITILMGWDSIENAKMYFSSPELKAAMKNAGVEGPSQIHYLNEA